MILHFTARSKPFKGPHVYLCQPLNMTVLNFIVATSISFVCGVVKYFPSTFLTLLNLLWHLSGMWLCQMRFQRLWDRIDLQPTKAKCDTEYWEVSLWCRQRNHGSLFQPRWMHKELLQYSLNISLNSTKPAALSSLCNNGFGVIVNVIVWCSVNTEMQKTRYRSFLEVWR